MNLARGDEPGPLGSTIHGYPALGRWWRQQSESIPMPTPVLRPDGTGAGVGGALLRREQIAAPVPAGVAFAAHLIARQLGLRTSEMLRQALAEFIEARVDQLADVEQQTADVLRAVNNPAFRQGRPRMWEDN